MPSGSNARLPQEAKGVLADIDDAVDEMVTLIYSARESEKSREVNL